MKVSKQSSSEKKNMQVEAKKAFEEYEIYEEMRNGIKVRAKISNGGWERSKEIELIADTGAIYTAIPEGILMVAFGYCCEGKEAI